ncbi:bifunctional polysaccharide deacetylase/glycosyltransferase family 2 protein [Dactylosporangium sp. NPDC000244]|uniref:bifunctional polysaccharide deacetylase/glycosyltransferase family 2 protein n=1 Tax=Dactylosporangium sp. NPDC000244 TaxID=3154365 RepID=UPI00331E9C75
MSRRRKAAKGARKRFSYTRLAFGVVLLSMLVGVLFVEAYVNAEFAADHSESAGSQSTVPQEVVDGGPIIDTRNNQVRSYAMPDKTIALTFDDGPDPKWTPEIMEVLHKHEVNATFFVVGTQVTRHAELVTELARGGDEIGIHSFTHPRLDQLSQWQRELEYSQTQLAVVKATGQKSALLRLPYSSSADAIDDANWPLIKDAGRLGYLSIMTSTDSRDWSRPGVDAIVRGATPEGDKGSIVLMHDAGGDRQQTVEALDRFIPMMQQRGYTFTTVSGALTKALAGQSVALEAPATPSDQRRALALVTAVSVADWIMELLRILFLIVGILTIGRTVALFLLAGRHARKRRAKTWQWGPPVDEPVSVIVPAYNEKEGIEAAVRSLAGGDHPGGIEVVVVDDGSTDNTSELVQALGLPNVRVVRIPNGGKPNALNVGVALAKHDIIVMVDGDTVFEPDSVRHLVQPFADPSVGAVAGNVKVGNRESIVARWQHIEYVIGFNLDRRLYDLLQVMPTIPGAIGAFRRQALRDIGGISHDTLAEDTDATMALCRTGWRVVYEERARAWTEAPSTLRQLWLQRYRWSYGTMQAMWKHRRSIVDQGPSGRFGRVGLPFIAFFGIALPLLAPLIDILLVYGLFFSSWQITTIAWVAMFLMQLLTAIVAFRLDKEKLRPLWVLPLQQFVYRQLMYIVLIQSMGTALTGARLRWHKLHRAGSAGASAPIPAQPSTPAASAVPAASAGPAASAALAHETPAASEPAASAHASAAPGHRTSAASAHASAASGRGMSVASARESAAHVSAEFEYEPPVTSERGTSVHASTGSIYRTSARGLSAAAQDGAPVVGDGFASVSRDVTASARGDGDAFGSDRDRDRSGSWSDGGGFGSGRRHHDASARSDRDGYGAWGRDGRESAYGGDGAGSWRHDDDASARGDGFGAVSSGSGASARWGGGPAGSGGSGASARERVPGDGEGSQSRGVAQVPQASAPGHRVSEHTAVLYASSYSSVVRSRAAELDGEED